MKKILMIAYYYPPFNNGGVQRIINFKKYLPDFGYEVHVITSIPCTRLANEKNVYRFYDRHYWPARKLGVLSKFLFRIKVVGIGLIKVLLGIVACGEYAWKDEVLSKIDKYLNVSSYDFILASFPPAANLEIGLSLSKKNAVPLIVDYRDGLIYDPPECVKISPFARHNALRLEREIAAQSVLQIAVNHILAGYYKDTYPKTKVISIPNGFDDEEEFSNDITITLPIGFNIIYTGAMEKSKKTYPLSYITKIIQDNSTVNFIFIGRYSRKERRILSLYRNVFLYEQMDRKYIIPIQRKADMLLLRTGDDPSGMSGKIFEYIFAKKPILHLGGDNVAKRIISETDTGRTFHPTDIEGIHNFIEDVRANKIEFKYIELKKYTRREQCKELASVLDSLYAEKKGRTRVDA